MKRTDAEIEAAANSDPDNLPLTPADFERMKDRTYRIESSNGVTQGPYRNRRQAMIACDRANAEAPGQGWHPVPEANYPK